MATHRSMKYTKPSSKNPGLIVFVIDVSKSMENSKVHNDIIQSLPFLRSLGEKKPKTVEFCTIQFANTTEISKTQLEYSDISFGYNLGGEQTDIPRAINSLQYILEDHIQTKCIESNPLIKLEKSLVQDFKMKYKINNNQKNIILGIGGSGPTKRGPAEKFIIFMHMALEKYDCRFFLATGSSEQEQFILNEILSTDLKEKCVALDKKNIDEIMPIIKNCQIAICNDSSFSHLSAALEIPTIVLMSDTPLLYGSYSPKMYPIIPDGETEVRHGTLGKDKINPEKIYSKFNEILD